MRDTRLYIDTKKIRTNIFNVQKYLGDDIQIMLIIKCNGYGTYLNKLIKIIGDSKYVGVALVDEGVALRHAGYEGKIFILYPPSKEEFKDIQQFDLFFNGCDIDVLENFDKNATKKLTIHIEIDTGMGRTGVQVNCTKAPGCVDDLCRKTSQVRTIINKQDSVPKVSLIFA